MKNIEKYNTQVRQAISDELIKCNILKAKAMKEYEDIAIKLANYDDDLTHNEYLNLSHRGEFLQRKIEDLGIESDIWDKAREICLNIADEIL